MRYALVAFNANGVVDSTIVAEEENKGFPSRSVLRNAIADALTKNVPGFNTKQLRLSILAITLMTEEEYEQFNQ